VTDRLGLIGDEDADHAGWFAWNLKDPSRFNGQVFGRLLVRRDENGRGCLRLLTEHRHTNLADHLHGGLLLALSDVAVFVIAYLDNPAANGPAVTLDLSMQFLGPGTPGIACDAVGEVLKETGRLVFVRGVIEQQGAKVAAFSGTLRKLSSR
jgi:uncharacterized protein (TIGR00369 family)